MRSDTGLPLRLRRTTRREAFDQRRAYFGPSAATIPEHEQHNILEFRKIGAIDDRAAEPLRRYQPGARQDGEMRRHCILWHREGFGDVTCRKPLRLVLH